MNLLCLLLLNEFSQMVKMEHCFCTTMHKYITVLYSAGPGMVMRLVDRLKLNQSRVLMKSQINLRLLFNKALIVTVWAKILLRWLER